MIRFDFSDFERRAREMDAQIRQLPFAISKAMNEAAKVARRTLIEETWPKHVEVRNRHFMRQALRTKFATKHSLRVEVYDQLGRGNLALHAKGGIKKAKSGRLAIPTKAVRLTARGPATNQKPRNLKRAVVKDNLIFEQVGRGKNARLRLLYKLQPTARQPADVPFHRDFADAFRREAQRVFPREMMLAMASRRRR